MLPTPRSWADWQSSLCQPEMRTVPSGEGSNRHLCSKKDWTGKPRHRDILSLRSLGKQTAELRAFICAQDLGSLVVHLCASQARVLCTAGCLQDPPSLLGIAEGQLQVQFTDITLLGAEHTRTPTTPKGRATHQKSGPGETQSAIQWCENRFTSSQEVQAPASYQLTPEITR